MCIPLEDSESIIAIIPLRRKSFCPVADRLKLRCHKGVGRLKRYYVSDALSDEGSDTIMRSR